MTTTTATLVRNIENAIKTPTNAGKIIKKYLIRKKTQDFHVRGSRVPALAAINSMTFILFTVHVTVPN